MDLSTNPSLLLMKFDDLGFFWGGWDLAFAWILLKCYTASDMSSTTMRKDLICSTASKTWRKKTTRNWRGPSLERQYLISYSFCVYSLCWFGRSVTVCVRVSVTTGCIYFLWFFCNVSDSFLSHPFTNHTWQGGLGIVVGGMQIQAVLEGITVRNTCHLIYI